MNFIHHFWPNLIKMNNFVKEFITPIVKVRKGAQVISFFTLNEYKKWLELQGRDASKWEIKYYKGLGTSSDEEAKEYFSNLRKHQLDLKYQN